MIVNDSEADYVYLNLCSFRYEYLDVSTKTLGVVGRGSGQQNSLTYRVAEICVIPSKTQLLTMIWPFKISPPPSA